MNIEQKCKVEVVVVFSSTILSKNHSICLFGLFYFYFTNSRIFVSFADLYFILFFVCIIFRDPKMAVLKLKMVGFFLSESDNIPKSCSNNQE